MPDKGAMHQMVRCSTPNQTREEDSIEEIEAESEEADMVNRHESATTTIGKRPGTHKGSSTEGGVILPYRATKIARSNTGIVENSATTKRSVERRNKSRLRLVNNSRTMP